MVLGMKKIFLYIKSAAAATKSLQSCPTLCDPRDGSPPGSPVPGILQTRTPEWLAIFFSNAWKWKVKVKSLSRVRLFATPWTAAYQAPPSMGFSRQEYWSGLPLPSPVCTIRTQQMPSFPGDIFLEFFFKKIFEMIYVKVKVTQLCLTLCDPTGCSTPDFPVHHQLPELDSEGRSEQS